MPASGVVAAHIGLVKRHGAVFPFVPFRIVPECKAAVHTVEQTAEQTDFIQRVIAWVAVHFVNLLRQFPCVHVDNRRVGVLYFNPFLFGLIHLLMVFVGNMTPLVLYHVSDINPVSYTHLTLANELNSSYNLFSPDSFPAGFFGPFYSQESDIPYYATVHRIYDNRTPPSEDTVLGTCLVLGSCDQLLAVCVNAAVPERSLYMVLDSNDEVIVRNLEYASSLDASIIQSIHDREEQTFSVGIEGETYLINWQALEGNTGWKVVSAVPVSYTHLQPVCSKSQLLEHTSCTERNRIIFQESLSFVLSTPRVKLRLNLCQNPVNTVVLQLLVKVIHCLIHSILRIILSFRQRACIF